MKKLGTDFGGAFKPVYVCMRMGRCREGTECGL